MITAAEHPHSEISGSGFVTDIKAQIPAGSYLVYCFRMPDYIRCDPEGRPLDGSNRAGRLFDSLEVANAYAKGESNNTAEVGFGVYNSSWQILKSYVSDVYTEKRSKAESPRRLFLWAGGLLICGAALVWFDAHSGWTAIFGVLIGARLLFAGVMKFGTALYRLSRNKGQS